MNHTRDNILAILDACCDSFTFPMLDNGYVYLAATRLTLFRSTSDWAITIEVFGFSPRAGDPDIHIYTFGSSLENRRTVKEFRNESAYNQYLANNPNNESRFIYPLDSDWIDGEAVAPSAKSVCLRGHRVRLPSRGKFLDFGIRLEDPGRVNVFELCRYLAAMHREEVLATPDELRGNLSPKMTQILQLNEWNHPNVVHDNCRPSNSETFQQLAKVLVTADSREYQPSLPPNTHWKNWPEGGTL
jgi:hypothetical protein